MSKRKSTRTFSQKKIREKDSPKGVRGEIGNRQESAPSSGSGETCRDNKQKFWGKPNRSVATEVNEI